MPARVKIPQSNIERLLPLGTVREATLYETLTRNVVRCRLCERLCALAVDELGDCKCRANLTGKLYTLVYGNLSAIESRPIEIKPFFHYWPGSTALTFSTWSCNLDCVWCQNYSLSKTPPDVFNSNYYPPEQIVRLTAHLGNEGMCASFQEPTLLTEWVADAFSLGRQRNLYCCFVSNGYMTLETLNFLAGHGLDAIKIDVKGSAETYRRYCGSVRGNDIVWRNAREAKRMGLHVEIVNLVVTGVNDDEASLRELVQRHVREAGVETPLHFTRYYPAWRFNNPPTKITTLELACGIAKSEGILFPYIGNVRGHRYENTYCPQCQELLILRDDWRVKEYKLTQDKRCPTCHYEVPLVGNHIRKRLHTPLWT